MNILLLANIGTWTNKYYHVGDEAMFITTLEWYKKHHPESNFYAFTSMSNHQNYNIKEIPHLLPVSYFKSKTFIIFLLKLILFKYFKKDFFNSQEKSLLEAVKISDIVHLVGGGHINSIYYDWLYYSLTIITIAKFFNKKAYITSHSLGPFKLKDLLISSLVLNQVNKIVLREPISTINKIKYLLFTKVEGNLDAAYFLNKSKIKIKQKTRLRIGISLHDFNNNKSQINDVMEFLKRLNKDNEIEILLIPHIIVTDENQHDEFFMNSLFKNFNVLKISNKKIIEQKGEIAKIINYLTSTCDLLISSRYHGLIFSLSNNVPCICLYNDKYYKQKFTGALKFLYNKRDVDKYLFKLGNKKFNSIKKIIENLENEKKYLADINRSIKNTKNFPCNFLLNELHQ